LEILEITMEDLTSKLILPREGGHEFEELNNSIDSTPYITIIISFILL
jgi:hypothetical protein